MHEKKLKYIFYFLSLALLAIMLLSSREAGISCDEVLHYEHSVSVYNYFKTHGEDKSALNTPVTNLKYYGQSYDNFVTIVTNWLNIEDVYSFRHLMSALAGWLAMLVTSLFAIWITGYGTGIITLILFAVSPTFFGHSLNNLKDIPFALGYIAATFFTLKFLVTDRKNSVLTITLLTLSIAFAISIRAGGLLLICYLLLFFFVYYLIRYITEKRIDFIEIRTKFILIICISGCAWFLSILLWPYALQSPVTNVIRSYHIMAHFPGTFRQVFEGKAEWSDFMPWYYLSKSMLITIPLIVLSGLVILLFFIRKMSGKNKILHLGFLAFTVLFPMVFVVIEKSNLYSSWRQFLFLYPAIVLLAATGFCLCFEILKRKILRWGMLIILFVLSYHPLKYMISNHPYHYLYYNQLVGGLKGAYSNYETDYYFTGQTEASEWLIGYLQQKDIKGRIKISATYPVKWQFRNLPEAETSYFRFEERSMSDWDYAIVTNRYIPPVQLRNKTWPPKNAIHIIYADQIPICAVLKRESKDDCYGYKALQAGRYKDAIGYFEQVLKIDDKDEMIFYNFAAALYNDRQYQKADSVLKEGLKLNPDFELILMYLGNIARSQNKTDEAIRYYERVVEVNRKYFEAYTGLAGLLVESDLMRARSLLRTCLTMSPGYKPAIIALADTYRKSDPEIARKYYELANTIK
jgi:tetratricopeptide (TPR) repeat protein